MYWNKIKNWRHERNKRKQRESFEHGFDWALLEIVYERMSAEEVCSIINWQDPTPTGANCKFNNSANAALQYLADHKIITYPDL